MEGRDYIHSFITHSLTHSFIPHVFITLLLCTTHRANSWEYTRGSTVSVLTELPVSRGSLACIQRVLAVSSLKENYWISRGLNNKFQPGKASWRKWYLSWVLEGFWEFLWQLAGSRGWEGLNDKHSRARERHLLRSWVRKECDFWRLLHGRLQSGWCLGTNLIRRHVPAHRHLFVWWAKPWGLNHEGPLHWAAEMWSEEGIFTMRGPGSSGRLAEESVSGF